MYNQLKVADTLIHWFTRRVNYSYWVLYSTKEFYMGGSKGKVCFISINYNWGVKSAIWSDNGVYETSKLNKLNTFRDAPILSE